MEAKIAQIRGKKKGCGIVQTSLVKVTDGAGRKEVVART